MCRRLRGDVGDATYVVHPAIRSDLEPAPVAPDAPRPVAAPDAVRNVVGRIRPNGLLDGLEHQALVVRMDAGQPGQHVRREVRGIEADKAAQVADP